MEYQEKIEKIKQTIFQFVPTFETLLSDNDWDKIIPNYLNRIDNIPEGLDNVISSTCLIDLIICSTKENEIGVANRLTVRAINQEIEKALLYCEQHPHYTAKIKDVVKKTLTEMDEDVFNSNSAFKNWINELFVFNLLTEWDGYEIIDIERSLGNGKTCDFVCRNCHGEEIWFEVVTLQRIDPSRQDDSATMNEFINNRIVDKYKAKTKDLLPVNTPNLRILPVIEYVEGLERFDISLNSDISAEPLSIMRNEFEGVVRFDIRLLNTYLAHIRAQQNQA